MKKTIFFLSILFALTISACGPEKQPYSEVRERVHEIDSLSQYTSVITAEDLKLREKIAELDSVCEYLY